MQKLLDMEGDSVSYDPVSGSGIVTVNVIFNEFVGAIDDQARATFHISSLSSNGITAPDEGDRFTVDSDVWTVVDVRDSKDDTFELRCDRSKILNS